MQIKAVNKILTIFFTALLQTTAVYAQEPADSLKKGPAPGGFNALQYSMQKRYNNQGDKFGNARIQDNMFFQVGVGYEYLSGSDESKFQGGFRYGASIGKLLTKLHGVRLNAYYAINKQYLGNDLTRVAISVDHLFDLTSYLGGYDPNRAISVSTFEGLGMQFATYGDSKATAPEGHFGLQIKLAPSSKFNIYAEPYIGLGGKGLFGDPETRNLFAMTYGVNFGLRYQIHDKDFVPKQNMNYDAEGDFLDLSTGAVLPISNQEGRGIGPSASIGYGRWFLSGMALRGSVQMSTSTWHQADYNARDEHPAYKANENSSYVGGRAELVIDPIEMLKGYEEWEKWKFRILGGMEFGYMYKANYYAPLSLSYIGPTVAARASYRIQDDLLLFIEPRLSFAYYNVPYENLNASEHYLDKLAGISVGLEFDRPVLKRNVFNESFRHFFQREWLIQVDAGFNQPLQAIRYQDHSYLDMTAGATVGYMISPSQTPAVRIDAARLNVDEEKGYRQYLLASVAPEYRFNLMNFLQGYEPRRKFEIQAFAGPVVSYRFRATKNKNGTQTETAAADGNDSEETVKDPKKNGIFIGGEAGANLRYRFLRNFGVYIEPRIRMYGKNLLPSDVNGGLKKVFSVQVGVSYQFNTHKKAKYVPEQ